MVYFILWLYFVVLFICFFFFFFQAEDGIRDKLVTGVQTCALPIWPGNVRQLKNCLERAVILANNGRITADELPPEVVRPTSPSVPLPASSPTSIPGDFSANLGSPISLRDVERQQILAALEQTNWHRGKTAEMLGISPSTLYRRLRDYNLERRPR